MGFDYTKKYTHVWQCVYCGYTIRRVMLDDLLKICFPDRSIESVGEIFFLENSEDLKSFFNKVLSSPIKEERFEWIESVDREYSNGCVVLNNEKTINIIGRTNFFKEVFQQ